MTNEDDIKPRNTNCMFMYRVIPEKMAEVNSAFSQALFRELFKQKDSATNAVTFPGQMQYWGGPEGTANLVNYARSDLQMTISEPPNAPKFKIEEQAKAIRA